MTVYIFIIMKANIPQSGEAAQDVSVSLSGKVATTIYAIIITGAALVAVITLHDDYKINIDMSHYKTWNGEIRNLPKE